MKAVPRNRLRRCRYICTDHRGCLIFLALPVPVIVLAMNWIDGTALKNLSGSVTIAGLLLLLIIVLVILTALRRAEYNYFEAVAKAAAELDEETPDKIVMELEENRGARVKDFLLRDPEKLFLLGKILGGKAVAGTAFHFRGNSRHCDPQKTAQRHEETKKTLQEHGSYLQ